MKAVKKALHKILLGTILLQLLACNKVGDPLIQKSIRNYSDLQISNHSKDEAKHLSDLNRDVKGEIKELPRMDIEDHLTESKTSALNYVADVNKKLLTLSDNVKQLSSQKFKTNQDGIPTLSKEEMAEIEHLTLLNLLSLRDMAQSSAAATFRLMTAFDREEFDNNEEMLKFKEQLMAHYLDSLSVITITENDLKLTMKTLSAMSKQKLLSQEAEEQISDLVGSLKSREKKINSEMKSFVKDSLTDKAQDKLAVAIKDHQKKVEGKTFLFDPAHPDHPALHMMVIVSNLSWGLINTMVGLGFVLTAAILAPVTHIAGAIVRSFGYSPLFYEIKFPKLRIARNRMQIYADVCGLGIVPGKMSAGLFELDFCSGQNFASAHEGGHAKQSALLGPLYFPAAILSYIINMGHGGFIESWADTWYVRDSR